MVGRKRECTVCIDMNDGMECEGHGGDIEKKQGVVKTAGG